MNAQLKQIETALAQAQVKESKTAPVTQSVGFSCSFDIVEREQAGSARSKGPASIAAVTSLDFASLPHAVAQPLDRGARLSGSAGLADLADFQGSSSGFSSSFSSGIGVSTAVHPRVETFVAQSMQEDLEPTLPRAKGVRFTTHRNSSNPAFTLSLLHDIALVVGQWQAELEKTHQQIQVLYTEGPIVDGWLESGQSLDGKTQGYRLCGLDEQGRVWKRLCPSEQLPSLSLAIARYQKLRQLLAHKKNLEVRLNRLAKTLTMLRGRLRAY
jgi:hypothetical protein